jgi:hypothetical protein
VCQDGYRADTKGFVWEDSWNTVGVAHPYRYGQPTFWWLHAHHLHPAYTPRREACGWLRGSDWQGAYPTLGPWYPVPVASPEWIDPWSMQGYHGYWWP